MKTNTRFTAVLWIVLAFSVVLFAGVIKEGPNWIAKAGFMIERMETAAEQVIFPDLEPGTIASHNLDWLKDYYKHKPGSLPLGIIETAEGWYITKIIRKLGSYVFIEVGGPNDFEAKIWIKEE